MDEMFTSFIKDAPTITILIVLVYFVFRSLMKNQENYMKELRNFREGRENVIEKLINTNQTISIKFSETVANHLTHNTETLLSLKEVIHDNNKIITQLLLSSKP